MKYVTIAQAIKDDIFAGIYEQSQKLPSEKELGQKYGVSKMTIRKTISLLIDNGVIFAKPKSGYYINTIDEIKSFNSLVGGSLHFMNKDADIRTVVLEFQIGESNEFLAQKFNGKKTDKIIHIVRVRYLNGKPYTAENIYMPYNLFPDMTKKDATGSIYNYIKNKGFTIGKNLKTISANFLTKEYEKELPNLTHLPMLYIENTGYLYNGDCFEYSLSFQINQDVSVVTEHQSILR